MLNTRNNFFFVLTLVGGFFAWRYRFAIQRRLESLGHQTTLLKGSIDEMAHSVASKVKGTAERGAALAEEVVERKAG